MPIKTSLRFPDFGSLDAAGGSRLVECRLIRRLCGPAADRLFRRIRA
jgi:hypothetical protein